MDISIYIIVAAVFFISAFFSSRIQLHMAQIEGYKPRQYWWWIKNNANSLFVREGLAFLLAAILYIVYRSYIHSVVYLYITVLLWSAASIYILYPPIKRMRELNKTLVYTHRAVRLFVLDMLILSIWAYLFYKNSASPVEYLLLLSGLSLLIPLNMLLSTLLIYPLEMVFQYRYFRSAQLKIRTMKGLKVIGITGSYGKTSTKYFLNTILSERYNTIMTPESYNTPMGITKVIREQLRGEHEVFLCEMGARNVGDIRTLCRLVNPAIGILTSIGPQHLETFKTITNIVRTKYELIQFLPYYGTAIFNGDNSYCLELARKTGIETFIYGVKNKEKDIYIYAEEIKVSREGLRFRVRGEDDIDFECQTSLLGKHNVNNILAAMCAAFKLGLTPEEIKSGVLKIKPVPHRLQLLDTDRGLTLIDDAFNSNPEGAREALETLREIQGERKFVVTPGMLELGAVEYEENKKLGIFMADHCDYAILIGTKRSRPIAEGLRLGNFARDKIIIVPSLNEAKLRLNQIARAGDVVLFENSLPDNYSE